jgi:hypothetical protein
MKKITSYWGMYLIGVEINNMLTMLATDICEPDDLIIFGDLDEIPNLIG